MRYSVVLVLLLQSAFLFAQERTNADMRADARKQFQTALADELAKTHHEWLYAHCDLFRRVTEQRVERQLATMVSTGAMLPLSDTSMDISRSADDENETSVAISRRDQNIIVAASNDVNATRAKSYVSTDAGKSWRTYLLPVVHDSGAFALGDPQLISDENGVFYYAFLIVGIDQSTGSFNISDLMVARSTNGKSWTLGTPVVGNTPITDGTDLLEDKESIAIDCDPKSPYHGRLYLAWTEYLSGSLTDYIAYSVDSGKTWSAPNALPGDDGYGFFANVRVGPGGTLYIGSSSHETERGGNALYVSHDGGETFEVHPADDITQFPLSNGYPRLKGINGFRSFPYFAYDVDDSNHITAAFGTYHNESYASLYLRRSTDEGATWGDAQPVGKPDVLEVDRFQPWVSFDRATKQTFVSYYSSEEDPINNALVRENRINANAPTQPQYIGGELFDPMEIRPTDPFIGDYCESDAYNGTYAVVWTQRRAAGTDGDVFAYVQSPNALPHSGVVQPINRADVALSEPMPNPALNTVTLEITSSEEYDAQVRLFDMTGAAVSTRSMRIDPAAKNALSLDLRSLSAGVYHLVVTTPTGMIERSVVHLR